MGLFVGQTGMEYLAPPSFIRWKLVKIYWSFFALTIQLQGYPIMTHTQMQSVGRSLCMTNCSSSCTVTCQRTRMHKLWDGFPTNKVGQRTQKQDSAQHAFFWKCCGVGSCALDDIDVRSSLKHRARWWYQGPQFTTACCVSYVYILLVAIAANVINF